MLDWVHSIRDRELPRLKRPSSLAPSGTQPIETVITELLASLCDLEGDVHRYSTRYEACVKVRLGQLSHRFKELSDVNNPQDVQWIKKVIDRPDVRNGVVSEPWIDELCEQLRRSITELGLSLGPKRANESSGIYKRCMRHVMDIAICLQGMHFSRCARTLFDLLKSEVECLYCENSTQFVPITKGFPLTTRGWAARLGCSCSLRLMESWNREVYTWHDPDDMTTLLDNIAEEYQRALQGLQYYSREFRADFERNTCSMKTMFARTRYLRGRYEEAHILLDDAMASVSFEQDTDERMALAVCELRRAECLILEADRKCQTMTDASNLIGTARASLDLARSSLEHAWQILSAEPGHVWRWSLLFLERTQLIHEEILITFLGPDASSSLSCQTRSQLLRRGLAAVSAGLDNVEKDWMRWNQLAILWWQFYLCYFVDRDLQMSESWQSWEKLNQRAGLLWFCGIQRDEQFKKFNGRIEACREAISRQMENRESNRTLRQLVIDLERTVLAPERVPKSDTDQPS